jgi:hypothetical protein
MLQAFDSSIRGGVLRSAILLAALLILSIGPVVGSPILLTFDDLPSGAVVGDFYNRGFTVGGAYGPGPNLGVSFTGPSPFVFGPDNDPLTTSNTIHSFGCCVQIDVTEGFQDGFSFFYFGPTSAIGTPLDVLDSGGHTLAHTTIGNLFVPGSGCMFNDVGPCSAVAGVTFTGTATSVLIGNGASQYLFDNLTFGSDVPLTTPVPEPSMQLLVFCTLGSLLWPSRNRRRGTDARGLKK